MSLQGSLRSLSIPDLFSLIYQHKKTGLLSLVSRTDERGILFNRGGLVYATAGDGSRRLGKFLVGLGFLNEHELGRSAGERGDTPFLGQDLIARGLISAEELNAAVREQILDILDEVLFWEEGAFHFDELGEEARDSLPTGPIIPTQSILLDAIRRFDESKLIRASFPDLAVVLKATGTADTLPEGSLVAPARSILELVDGRRAVAQVLRDSDLSPYETSLHLTLLSREGHIQPVSAPPEADELPMIPEPWSLPVSPDLPGRIYWIFRQSGRHTDQLAEAISREPALAAKALRQFTAARKDLAVGDHAVSRIVEGLGELRARALVIPEAIRGIFFAEKDYFWKDCREHSLLCAHLCRTAANLVHYPAPEEAYLTGLLHNLGAFILIGLYPERYRAVQEEARTTRRDIRELEQAAFGMSHLKIGTIYAERWRFPRPIVQAIRLHHQAGEVEAGPLLDILALAMWIAQNHQLGVEFSFNAQNQIEGALGRFKLKKQKVLAILESTALASPGITESATRAPVTVP